MRNRASFRATLAGAAMLVLLALLAGPRPAWAQDDVGIKLGTVPGPVQLQDLQGHTVELGRYIGKKPVLLEFWATWCPICKALEPRMAAAYRKYGKRVDFLRISVAVNESPASIRRHLAKHPMPGHVLWDAHGQAVRVFQTPTTSYVVILNANGHVAYTGTGSDQNLDAALAKVAGPAGAVSSTGPASRR